MTYAICSDLASSGRRTWHAVGQVRNRLRELGRIDRFGHLHLVAGCESVYPFIGRGMGCERDSRSPAALIRSQRSQIPDQVVSVFARQVAVGDQDIRPPIL